MSSFAILKLEYSACVEELVGALGAEDEQAFFAAVDHMVHMREPGVLNQLRSVTGDLQQALERFSVESRLQDIATNEIPDARARLRHVISMTDQAAHRTLDLVEESCPLADHLAQQASELSALLVRSRAHLVSQRRDDASGAAADDALSATSFAPLLRSLDTFLPELGSDAERIRKNLGEVLLAQGYQDLTGQIIRNVMTLVEELETALAKLASLSDDIVEHATLGDGSAGAQGPTVPGVSKGEVAAGQTDVDALLSDLGM